MYLKALRIRGFKSFAEPTSIELEPGLTVIVGPNGSGKSNVVDALAWVLGAQGPRALRSGRMDDVIFAGTSTRPGLGRAEVEVVLADPSGLLELGASEVSVRRAMLRSGDSEYSINGVDCRLTDVQELLGRAGIGRQQHLLVSQGNLDSVLEAGPSQRRALIEEAAGIQQFRRRREQAERRLERTQADVDRMADLVSESARQLRPLRRQAEVARRHGELGRRRAHLERQLALAEAARTLALLGELEAEERARRARAASLEQELEAADAEAVVLEHELAAQATSWEAPLLARAERAAERAAAGTRLVQSRLAGVAGELSRLPEGGRAAEVVREQAEVRAQLAELERSAEALAAESLALESDEATLQSELEALRLEEEAVDVAGEDAVEDDGGAAQAALDDLSVSLRRTSVELEQLRPERGRTLARIERLEADLATARAEAAVLERSVEGLRVEQDGHARHAASVSARLGTLEPAVQEASALLEEHEREVARWRARRDALAEGLAQAHSRAGAERLAGKVPMLGVLADLVEVDEGWERALEAAFGESGAGVVVPDAERGKEALGLLAKAGSEGTVVVAEPGSGSPGVASRQAPAGSSWLSEHVRARSAEVAGLLERLLADVVAVDGAWQDALGVHRAAPHLTVVSTRGDRMGALAWRVGVAGTGATAAALELAESTLAAAEAGLEERRTTLASLRGSLDVERRSLAEAERAEAEVGRRAAGLSAQMAALEERRRRDQAELEALRADAEAAEERIASLEAERDALRAAVEEAEAEVARWRERRESLRTEHRHRRRLLQDRRAAWERRRSALAVLRRDLEARAAAAEERRALLIEREGQLSRYLAAAEAAEEEVEERRRRLGSERAHLERLGAALGELGRAAEALVGRCRDVHEASGERLGAAARRLEELRARRRDLELERADLEDAARRAAADRRGLELEHARWSQALQSVPGSRGAEGTGQGERDGAPTMAEPEAGDAEAGVPGRDVPDGAPSDGAPTDVEAVRAELAEVERALERLGPVNSLALVEVAQVQARHELLEAQLEDVRRARSEIVSLLSTIDAEMSQRFAAAFAEVARRFSELFEVVFPGGRGALVLDADADPFEAGVEIEARPPGKSVRRLSLLSGGERSLVAIALLFAVFQSCPAPFYVMDEVEAALDDVNLSRFLDLLDRLCADAQVIVITHQRRTMERADRLLGVTMQPGGSSRVVTERLAASQRT
jgi:chromosome segregation protein